MRRCQAMAGTIWHETILNQSVLKLVDQVSLINQNFSLLSCCQYRAIARLSNGNKWNEVKFNTVKNKEHHLLLSVKTQQSAWWCKHSQPCLHQLHVLCSDIQCFHRSHLLCSAFGLCSLHPPPIPSFIFHWYINVTGAWCHWHRGSFLEGAGLPAMGVTNTV